MEVLKTPPSFSFDQTNVGDAWRRWQSQFETYYTACELSEKKGEVQVAILLHAAGPEAQEIEKQFSYDEAKGEKKTDYKTVLKKFSEYCHPRKNVVFERYRFWQRGQQKGETVDTWVKELKILANNCEFGTELDNMLRDKLVFGVADERVKERMLREPDLTLIKAVDLCRAAETTRMRMQEMTLGASSSAHIDAVRKESAPKSGDNRSMQFKNSATEEYSCRKCGTRHKQRECIAYGKQCKVCKGFGHFGVFHKSQNFNRKSLRGPLKGPQSSDNKKVDMVDMSESGDQSDSESDLFFGSVQLLNVDSASLKNNDWVCDIHVGDTDIEFKIDSGAQGNILPLSTYERVKPSMPLKPTNVRLAGFTRESRIKPLGEVVYKCVAKNGREETSTFYVVAETDTPLLGRVLSEKLGLITLINSVVTGPQLTWDKLKQLYPQNFDNKLGDLGDPVMVMLTLYVYVNCIESL